MISDSSLLEVLFTLLKYSTIFLKLHCCMVKLVPVVANLCYLKERFTGSFSIGKTRLRAKVTDKTFTPSRPRTDSKRDGYAKRASSPEITTKNEKASSIVKSNFEHDSSPSPEVNGQRQSFDLGNQRLNLLTNMYIKI